MELLNQILVSLFSLTGVLFGIGLRLIAPEELIPGKKYFILFKRFLFLLAIALVVFYLFQEGQFYLLSFFVLISLTLFAFDFKIKNKYYYNYTFYPLMLAPYFLTRNISLQLIIASLIFLYGFPLGGLYHEKEKRS